MSQLTPAPVEAYLASLRREPHPLLASLERQGRAEGLPLVSPETGALLHALARATGGHRILEVGTAIGYSAIWLGSALAEDGVMPAAATVTLGLFGAALFFSDGAITPAITVMSAVEGLSVMSPAFSSAVIPLVIVILVLLFNFQKRGTGAVGGMFGPVMVIWFLSLAVLGVSWIVRQPSVLAAVNPAYAIDRKSVV